ncbi:MAG: 2-oxoglutarate dehydrogenase E1 component [Flavobacteriales bacterium]|nr:2-oxoglutarate dehydrogenase E1 component [Flavobacteriales bacterium]
MDKFSYLGSVHSSMIEDMYSKYLSEPTSVSEEWGSFFKGYEFGKEVYGDELPQSFHKEFKIINLIDSYRKRGHLFTKTNPVRDRRKYTPSLDFKNFGLEENDLDKEFQAGEEIGIGTAKLSEIISHLDQVYCQSIGIEYMYIPNPEEIDWIKRQLHTNTNTRTFSVSQKKHILHKLNQAVAFENFLHKKFVGQKRFSLEGAESLIPALDELVEHSSNFGVDEFVMGMAHRGRLNVLANIFNKTYKDIFSEFEGKLYENEDVSGDVKYHNGETSIQTCSNGNKIKLSLSPNPSHLEAVDPVVQGITRAKIDEMYSSDTSKVVPIMIHGDSALAGQGVVYEVVQMANLKGYSVGGTIHIVVNNQVGFTTNYLDARSSIYCTDVAKVTLSPVFHVNGDDVEAVVHALKIAVEYRQEFKKDVFIDLLCYRKYGHNEGDEPRFTQPKLYNLISKHPNPREIYKQKLLKEGVVESSIINDSEQEFQSLLQDRFDEAKEIKKAKITPFLENEWRSINKTDSFEFENILDTGCEEKKLMAISKVLYEDPQSDKLFKKLQRLLKDKVKLIGEDKFDWSIAESLSYATLLKEGFNIRISGQDVERGTFSHRHAKLKLEVSEESIVPLDKISEDSNFSIYNSHLSEYGVLGFEYGYSITTPNTLTIWEAQFGDFANGAQIMIDQFISCAEDKWMLMSGLVMLLPHGYEGQGAEHSSARVERFLQLCAGYNIEVANCTTPANFFHLIRRQVKRNYRKPLVVFTPKSLLRHPKCISSISDFNIGKSFKHIIDDDLNIKNPHKLIFCTGKIYYEAIEMRSLLGVIDIAIIRIEQLYPIDMKEILRLISKYNSKSIVWLQEEPENMGAWSFILRSFISKGINISLVSRKASAATASGSSKTSEVEQNELLNQVFN